MTSIKNQRKETHTKKKEPRRKVEKQHDEFQYPTKQSIGFLLRRTHLYCSRLLAVRIASENISLGIWYFLRALWDKDGVTQRELSQHLGAVEPTAVTALEQMERRGLVWRGRDAGDRRRRIVYLTEKGKELKNKLLPCAVEVNEIALEGFSAEEVQNLRHLLLKVKSNLDSYNSKN